MERVDGGGMVDGRAGGQVRGAGQVRPQGRSSRVMCTLLLRQKGVLRKPGRALYGESVFSYFTLHFRRATGQNSILSYLRSPLSKCQSTRQNGGKITALIGRIFTL